MKTLLSGFIVLSLLTLYTSCAKESHRVADPQLLKQLGIRVKEQRLPAFDFSEKDIFRKSTVALNHFNGKVVMLNFWATWCPPCRKEIPALEAIEKAHSGTLEVIGVSVFCSTSSTEQFYREMAINYPMIYGSFDLMDKYWQVSTIPTTFLIDKEGLVAARIIGSRTQQQYEEMLAPLLAE
jgi:cytochrome c biogenesis protein CcmG, thiol:disulfide interchange protein DsbE